MPNIITGLRIICSFILLFCQPFTNGFYCFYLFGAISDIADGLVARYFNKETTFGAKFDTFSDIVYTLVVGLKILSVVYIPIWVIIWIIVILIIKIINIILGFIFYKKFTVEHTIMNKICGFLLFIFVFLIKLLSLKYLEILTIITCLFCLSAAVLECYNIMTGKEKK